MKASPLVLLAACGPGLTTHAPTASEPIVAASGDPAALRQLMRGSVMNGGLQFAEPECARQFPAGRVESDHFDAFAKCLAGLHFQASPRKDPYPDGAVLTYAPGFEIEALVFRQKDGPRLAWIGYSARADLEDSLPTISPEAFEALRTAGDRSASGTTTGEAWLKVCIDETGAVSKVQVRETDSVAASRVFAAAAHGWRFRPFVVANQPLPVCSMVRVRSPDAKATAEVLPTPPTSSNEPVNLSPITLEARRVAGEKQIYPNDETKAAIQAAGVSRVIGSFKLCVDETGHVDHVRPIRSTGIHAYDEKILRTIATWAYRPYIEGDHAIPVCTAVTFIYSQH